MLLLGCLSSKLSLGTVLPEVSIYIHDSERASARTYAQTSCVEEAGYIRKEKVQASRSYHQRA